MKAGDVLLDGATQGCSDQYKFSETRTTAALELTTCRIAIDYLTDDLKFMGASDAAIDGVVDTCDALGADDVDLFYDTGWRDNANFLARLNAELLNAGFPDKAEDLAMAHDIFEISAMADEARYSFMFAEE